MRLVRGREDRSAAHEGPRGGRGGGWQIALCALLCLAVTGAFLITGNSARATLQTERASSPLAMVKLGNRYINLGLVSTIVESGSGTNKAKIEFHFLGEGQNLYILEGAEAEAVIRFLRQNVTDITPPESKSGPKKGT